MKANALKMFIRSVLFIAVFCIILSALTIIYIPKWHGTVNESGQLAGFYKEPENTIDVLYLGSCNMYSSISPVLVYEKYRITGYAMCTPDQEMSTSYYFLKEALKTQDIKAVVIESLFLTENNSGKREYYNRYAMDYMPLSINKLEFAWDLSKRESEHMKKYDKTTPDRLLTFAGYLFPLLRYHSRDDLTTNDFTDFFINSQYNYYKGGFPQYSYTYNDDLFFDMVFNGKEINEISKKYVPMIKEICEKNGIKLVFVKSPNYARWGYDDKQTNIIKEYLDEQNIELIDCHASENNTYEEWDYGYQTGRLNQYGVKKFSDTVGNYLTENLNLKETTLSDEDKKKWENCIDWYYKKAEENGFSIYPGSISQICNREGAIRIRWNEFDDCNEYSIYRCEGEEGTFELLSEHCTDVYYFDDKVKSLQGYSYYIVPNEGSHIGEKSKSSYYVYVDLPENLNVENVNGAMLLKWDTVEGVDYYRLQRRYASDFNFVSYDTTTKSSYLNKSVNDGTLYYYRLSAVYKENGKTYSSMTTIVRGMPQKTPVISTVTVKDGKPRITWNKISNQTSIEIYRKSESEDYFVKVAELKANLTQFTDENVEKGLQYFYKIVSTKESYGFYGISEESNTVGVKVPK